MTEKAIAKNNERIKKKNAAFAKMSVTEQRIQIARDVLDQLKAKRFKAKSGVYLEAKRLDRPLTKKELASGLRGFLGKLETCDVCALGAMFACTVEAANKIKTGDAFYVDFQETFLSTSGMRTYLEKYFSVDELTLIENAFECGTVRYPQGSEAAALNPDAIAYNYGVATSRRRMERIMRNIIRNNGVFVPTDPK